MGAHLARAEASVPLPVPVVLSKHLALGLRRGENAGSAQMFELGGTLESSQFIPSPSR